MPPDAPTRWIGPANVPNKITSPGPHAPPSALGALATGRAAAPSSVMRKRSLPEKHANVSGIQLADAEHRISAGVPRHERQARSIGRQRERPGLHGPSRHGDVE